MPAGMSMPETVRRCSWFLRNVRRPQHRREYRTDSSSWTDTAFRLQKSDQSLLLHAYAFYAWRSGRAAGPAFLPGPADERYLCSLHLWYAVCWYRHADDDQFVGYFVGNLCQTVIVLQNSVFVVCGARSYDNKKFIGIPGKDFCDFSVTLFFDFGCAGA